MPQYISTATKSKDEVHDQQPTLKLAQVIRDTMFYYPTITLSIRPLY
jgi:hypothetical protein